MSPPGIRAAGLRHAESTAAESPVSAHAFVPSVERDDWPSGGVSWVARPRRRHPPSETQPRPGLPVAVVASRRQSLKKDVVVSP